MGMEKERKDGSRKDSGEIPQPAEQTPVYFRGEQYTAFYLLTLFIGAPLIFFSLLVLLMAGPWLLFFFLLGTGIASISIAGLLWRATPLKVGVHMQEIILIMPGRVVRKIPFGDVDFVYLTNKAEKGEKEHLLVLKNGEEIYLPTGNYTLHKMICEKLNHPPCPRKATPESYSLAKHIKTVRSYEEYMAAQDGEGRKGKVRVYVEDDKTKTIEPEEKEAYKGTRHRAGADSEEENVPDEEVEKDIEEKVYAPIVNEKIAQKEAYREEGREDKVKDKDIEIEASEKHSGFSKKEEKNEESKVQPALASDLVHETAEKAKKGKKECSTCGSLSPAFVCKNRHEFFFCRKCAGINKNKCHRCGSGLYKL